MKNEILCLSETRNKCFHDEINVGRPGGLIAEINWIVGESEVIYVCYSKDIFLLGIWRLTHQHNYSIMTEAKVSLKVRRIEMNFYLTNQPKKKLGSVQSIPMKHCAEYGV